MFLSLISGSSGNASLLYNERTKILIDCGLSAKRLCGLFESIDIEPNEIDAILISHEHNDHITGAGVMSRRFDIPIYATKKTYDAMNIGKIKEENIQIINSGTPFSIGDFFVNPFSLSHDAADPVGFSITDEKYKYSVVTDTGIVSNTVFDAIEKSDYILLEANHDTDMLMYGDYPFSLKKRISGDSGHMSNDYCAAVAMRLLEKGTKNIMLSHLSNNNNTPELAYKTVENEFLKHGAVCGTDYNLSVANRYEVTKFI